MNILKDSETLRVGDVFRGSRQFTRHEVEVFCEVTRDRNPLHRDQEFARASRFGRLIVPGLLVTSMFTDVLSDWDLLATEVQIQFVGPVYADDTIEMTIEIDKKEGPLLSGRFSCTARSGKPVIQGALKGVSIKSKVREN